MPNETSEKWSKRVERWQESGLPTAEFASEIGVNPRTLTYWKWRLKKEAAAPSAAAHETTPATEPKAKLRTRRSRAVRFVEVTEPRRSESHIEIILADSTTLRVHGEVDEESLRRVISALRVRR